MIICDVFEPVEIQELISKTVPTSKVAINSQGYADYLWHDIAGHSIQVERKQVGELLGSEVGFTEGDDVGCIVGVVVGFSDANPSSITQLKNTLSVIRYLWIVVLSR